MARVAAQLQRVRPMVATFQAAALVPEKRFVHASDECQYMQIKFLETVRSTYALGDAYRSLNSEPTPEAAP